MKNNIVISIVIVFLLSACGNSGNDDVDVSKLPILRMGGSYVYDPDNIYEAVGVCDYVFVGKITSNNGTQYDDGAPNTLYTVIVLKNIKGRLVTDVPIDIAKQGGIVSSKNAVLVHENDSLPILDRFYVFRTFAQKDGSLLIAGPHSNVLLDITDEHKITSTQAYQDYESAYKLEIVPVDVERFTSMYDISVFLKDDFPRGMWTVNRLLEKYGTPVEASVSYYGSGGAALSSIGVEFTGITIISDYIEPVELSFYQPGIADGDYSLSNKDMDFEFEVDNLYIIDPDIKLPYGFKIGKSTKSQVTDIYPEGVPYKSILGENGESIDVCLSEVGGYLPGENWPDNGFIVFLFDEKDRLSNVIVYLKNLDF